MVDAKAGEVLGVIPVGKRPRGLRLAPDGKTVYVALSGSPRGGPNIDESTLPPADHTADGIGVVDLDAMKLVRTIESGSDPEAFDLVGDATLVVSNEDDARVSIVDIPSGRVRARVAVGREPEGVTTDPAGALVYVTSEADGRVDVVDPVAARVVATIPTGARPRSVAFSADGTRAFVADESDGTITVVDARAHTALARTEVPKDAAATGPARPMGTARSPDGTAIYVTTGRAGSIAVLDASTGALVRTIRGVGARPWGIAAGSDELYTANGSSNDVSVVNLSSGNVRRIAVGQSPWGVVIAR